MTFDFYAYLAALGACPTDGTAPKRLASGLVDGCTVWFAINEIQAGECDARLKGEQDQKLKRELEQKKREHERTKNDARRCYMERAKTATLQLPCALDLDPWPPALLHDSWLAIDVDFELLTPWYSKDDRVFHVLDNPVRKDRVFGVPFMAAASWKGMLRWAFRMVSGLAGPQEHSDENERKKALTMEVHLFGNEKGETEHERLHGGALVFYPTWFDRIGFEVINPHSRVRRAGTQPIYYEVVPPGAKGTLRLLYAPLPGAGQRDGVSPSEAIEKLLEAIEQLLTAYGISAKRTVGWGTAKIKEWKVYRKDGQPIQKTNRSELWADLQRWLAEEARP